MSVATPYFDEVFNGLETLPGRIDRVQRRIEKREARLERLLDKPPSEKNLNRIQNTFDLIIYGGNVKAELEKTLQEYQAVELPKDEFNIRLESDEILGYVKVDVTDSPYDDTYEAGDPLMLRFGATKICGPGEGCSRRSGHSTTTLANGEYWTAERGGTQTLSAGQGSWKDRIDNYNTAYASLYLDPDPQGEWNDRVSSMEMLATQTFDLV